MLPYRRATEGGGRYESRKNIPQMLPVACEDLTVIDEQGRGLNIVVHGENANNPVR